MSHLLLMDESNGNGVLNIMAPNTNTTLIASLSNEDLSQSLSEYTDADESMSAPTEYLAEFLSAVMVKDYQTALKYCKLILKFEPNNATAKEFHPLIMTKLKESTTNDDSGENHNTPSSSPNSVEIEIDNDCLNCNSIEQGASEGSLSSNGTESDYSNSSDGSGDEKELDASNSNTSNNDTQSDSSDNTTHSYSSLLLEEEEDEISIPLKIQQNEEKSIPNVHLVDLKDAFNGNVNYISTSCSDSESPTEPLTQKLVAILRSKCIPKSSDT